jgi:hypothetical protein
MLAFGLDAYGAAIVAEGIETEGEFKTLRGLGCRFGQGFYLGRPGRLRLPRRQPDSTEQLWAPSGSEEASPSTSEPVEVFHDPGSKATPRDIGRDGQQRDTQEELFALVAEIRTPPGKNDQPWKGDHSRVQLSRS